MANKKKIQEINAGSMADISFLLLIFFLVATTMNVDTGIQRVLPQLPDPNQKQEAMDVKERNILKVFVSKFDQIMVNGQVMDITQIKDKALEFILNPADSPDLPEKKMTPIEGIPGGAYPVSEGVISLQNDRGTSYNVYIMVQNELTRAFNEIRNNVSKQKFGKNFPELSEEQRGIIQKAVPMKISEAEPRNIEGGK